LNGGTRNCSGTAWERRRLAGEFRFSTPDWPAGRRRSQKENIEEPEIIGAGEIRCGWAKGDSHFPRVQFPQTRKALLTGQFEHH
jgi:hypothetical protein